MTIDGHQPVLYEPVLNYLTKDRVGTFVDGTFGGGGHTRGILEADERNHVLAFDCDPDAIDRAKLVESEFGSRFRILHSNFDQLTRLEEGGFAGILFDFGVSSYHLDDGERGFSFRTDAPLDMRMNPTEGIPASEFLKRSSHETLVQAVRDFGEETRWRKIVHAIEDARGSGHFDRTLSFAKLIEDSVGGRKPWEKIHPATKTFQGIRIAVNGELASIEQVLPAAFERLRPGGRLAAISFHSLEDRLVKRRFKQLAGQPEHRHDSRLQSERIRRGDILTRKPVIADDTEVLSNPRARSAKLRVIERMGGFDE